MKKKILLPFLCVVILLTCSCGDEKYTREVPYIVDLNGYKLPEAITLENNTDLYHNFTIESFLNFTYKEEVLKRNSAVMIIEPLSSTSFYWNEGKNDIGGYTITELKIEAILEEGGNWGGCVKEGDVFEIIQLFNVQPDGKVVFPEYEYIDCLDRKYLSNQYSRKIMDVGKRYIYFFDTTSLITGEESFGFVLDGGPNVGEFVCYYPNSYGKSGEKCLLNGSEKGGSVAYKRFGLGYEFSEEAYEASKAIVDEYTAEGKTMVDGSYYHYHGMVVDCWERYSDSIE